MNLNTEIIKGFIEGLRPEQRLTVSQWADEFRVLSTVSSAEPGKWRTARTPYLKEIMDKLSVNDPAQEIIVMKGAQVGLTEAGCNWIGYTIDVAPCPMLAVQPTKDMAERNSKIRIQPMIDSCPSLSTKVRPARSRDSGNTVLKKEYPGGVLVMPGANAAAGLRSMPARNLFLDEVDAYPLDLDGEGSPIDLAKARTRTFPKKKIFIISTPTIQGGSIIEAEFLTTSQKYYHVPCPHCGALQILKFDRLRWKPGDFSKVTYECEHCNESIQERFKPKMFAAGLWMSTVPEMDSIRRFGYHISSLYSPFGWYSWAQAAEDYEKAAGDIPKLKTFTNTVLGETWKEEGDAPPWESVYNRREMYPQNKPGSKVAFLTCGVDIQKDRIELEIVGWSHGKQSYSIDYRVLLGNTSGETSEVWGHLAKVLDETWEREDGALLSVRLMAIDSGYNSSEVYSFCRKYDPSRVIPTKGKDAQSVMISPPRAVDTSRSGKKINDVKIWHIGVSLMKSELYGWLRLQKNEDGTYPNGYCHFPQYDSHYFKGLTAEVLESKKIRGFDRFQWVKKYERNEPLDCRVIARAAASVIGMDRFKDEHWNYLVTNVSFQKKNSNIGSPPKKKKSSFWDK